MKIFQTPSYDRFCLFEMERKSKDFRGMDDNVAYKNKQIDNVEISNEGRRALWKKLREVKPKVEEPIGYELTIQDTRATKKAEEEKAAKKRTEKSAERKETGDYTLSVTGTDVKSMTQSLVAGSVSISVPDRSSFDIKV